VRGADHQQGFIWRLGGDELLHELEDGRLRVHPQHLPYFTPPRDLRGFVS
jgi:hypothetical protein